MSADPTRFAKAYPRVRRNSQHLAMLPWAVTGYLLEDFGEGTCGLIPERPRDFGNRISGAGHPVFCEQHPPACQVFDRRLTDGLLEFERKSSAGHARLVRQFLNRPIERGFLLHAGNCPAHLRVR